MSLSTSYLYFSKNDTKKIETLIKDCIKTCTQKKMNAEQFIDSVISFDLVNYFKNENLKDDKNYVNDIFLTIQNSNDKKISFFKHNRLCVDEKPSIMFENYINRHEIAERVKREEKEKMKKEEEKNIQIEQLHDELEYSQLIQRFSKLMQQQDLFSKSKEIQLEYGLCYVSCQVAKARIEGDKFAIIYQSRTDEEQKKLYKECAELLNIECREKNTEKSYIGYVIVPK